MTPLRMFLILLPAAVLAVALSLWHSSGLVERTKAYVASEKYQEDKAAYESWLREAQAAGLR